MQLGVYQCAAGKPTPQERLEGLDTVLTDHTVDLLVCPELFATGYHAAAATMAEPQNGPFGQAVAALAAKHKVTIAYGYPEAAEGVVYNAAALYDSTGACIANHRKCIAAPGSLEVDAFANGQGDTLVMVHGWKVAMLICYEVEFPELVRRAAQAGAELLIVPTALGAKFSVVANRVVPARAYENGLVIAYADQIGVADGLRFYGGSRVVAPDGHVVASTGREVGVAQCEIKKEWIEVMRTYVPFLTDCKTIEGAGDAEK